MSINRHNFPHEISLETDARNIDFIGTDFYAEHEQPCQKFRSSFSWQQSVFLNSSCTIHECAMNDFGGRRRGFLCDPS